MMCSVIVVIDDAKSDAVRPHCADRPIRSFSVSLRLVRRLRAVVDLEDAEVEGLEERAHAADAAVGERLGIELEPAAILEPADAEELVLAAGEGGDERVE